MNLINKMMRNHYKSIIYGAILPVCAAGILAGCRSTEQEMKTYSDALTAEAVVAVTNDAVQWQINEYPNMNARRKWKSANDVSWENAIFLTAVAEWSYLQGDTSAMQWVRRLAVLNDYRLGNGNGVSHIYHADNLIAGMLYADLYEQDGDERVIVPTCARLEYIKNHPASDAMAVNREDSLYNFKKRWSWCDALYMAPQVFARYAQLTGDPSLLAFMDREFWAATDFLYSPEWHLYWRDSNYFDKTEANGLPVFWGRGNGWVAAGLAKLIPYLPADWAPRQRYVTHYQTMMRAIVDLQSPDGHWFVSMLDPESYPSPEMSSTGFFCYALWWGINNGLLDKETYLQPAVRAWQALVHAMQPTGMLGSVQAVGEKPESIRTDMTEVYGPAAMVYSAIEILKYIDAEE